MAPAEEVKPERVAVRHLHVERRLDDRLDEVVARSRAARSAPSTERRPARPSAAAPDRSGCRSRGRRDGADAARALVDHEVDRRLAPSGSVWVRSAGGGSWPRPPPREIDAVACRLCGSILPTVSTPPTRRTRVATKRPGIGVAVGARGPVELAAVVVEAGHRQADAVRAAERRDADVQPQAEAGVRVGDHRLGRGDEAGAQVDAAAEEVRLRHVGAAPERRRGAGARGRAR